VRESIKTKSAIPALILVGATIATLTEAIWDILGNVWYPEIGQTPMYRFFNASVPIWMLAAYPLYLGGLGYAFYKKLISGMATSYIWKFYLVSWVANAVIEIPALQLGVYEYYGAQPFKVLGFPLWQAMGNSLMPVIIGASIFGFRQFLVGARQLLILPMVPMAQCIALMTIGWPTFVALHSGHGYAWTYPAAMISFGISLLLVALVAHAVTVPDRSKNRT
jgi:hypothetical protein